MKKEPVVTRAQKIYGAKFGNIKIITERPPNLRSSDPDEDKKLFRDYKSIMRKQTQTIKQVLRWTLKTKL